MCFDHELYNIHLIFQGKTTTAAEIYANNYVITTVVLDLLSFQIFVVV